ncbi:MAG: hypothetical protein JNM38_08170 [Acidobacteria bacterium]|nr:hypothetical protein [Acidobacteriota bacterium]
MQGTTSTARLLVRMAPVLVAFGIALGAAALPARQPAGSDVALETSVPTVVGEFVVERDEVRQDYALVLNGRRLVENEGAPIYLSPLIKGKRQDFVLVYVSSGGIACPGTFRALRVKSPVVLSEAFGTCSDSYRAKVEGDRLVVTMPAYIAHPEEFEPADLARARRTEVIYTYVDGLLSEREVVRK